MSARLRVDRRLGKLAGMRATGAMALAVIALFSGPRAASAETESGDGAPTRVIAYDRDTLTVHLVKVPISDVLAELGRQSGADILGSPREARDVSAEFEAVPLAEALARLLGNQNFALVYREGGKLRAVKLLGGPQTAAAAPGAVTTSTTVPGAEGGAVSGLVAAVENHQPVTISGRLSQVLGTETVSLRQLVDVSLHHENAGVRAEAVRAGLQVIENDPTFRATVLSTVNGLDENSVLALLRGSAGEHAEELAMHVATQSRVVELRTKAAAVLQRLRTGG